jgi:hypothetical protein
MAANYSYKPARYSSGNMGKITHTAARKYTIKLYNQDLKIAQQHYDDLKRARTTGEAPPIAQVPAIEPNPGNPLQFTSSKEAIMTDAPIATDGHASISPLIQTHEAMYKFHKERAKLFLDATRDHLDMENTYGEKAKEGMSSGTRADNDVKVDDDFDDLPSTNLARLPSIYDIHTEGFMHDPDKGLEYHQVLHGDALLEAHHYRRVAEKIKQAIDDLDDTVPNDKRNKLQESMDVCESMYNLYNDVSEMHDLWSMDFKDYLKRRADRTFGYEPDNTDAYPPVAEPNPDPFKTPGPAAFTSPDPN